MSLDPNGRQVGAIKAVGLGVGIQDLEGVTTDGTYFYVVSSQSKPKAIAGEGLVRFKFDARSQSVEAVESISGAAENQDQTDFGLWEWNGDEQQPALRETNRFDPKLKPEGVARVTVGSRDFTLIVFDASGYTAAE